MAAKRTLFLNPPSFDDFDGGAGARYQATREVRSFWYPTWLTYPAGMLDNSRVVDAPAQNLGRDETLKLADDFDMVVLYTSTPSLKNDILTAKGLKDRNPKMLVGFVGPHPSVLPELTLKADPVIDFVVREEFDYAIPEIANGMRLEDVKGIHFRRDGVIVGNPDRPVLEDLDILPFASKVYARDLVIKDYEIPWMKFPYISIYTGRGCGSKCTFCLWPQTFSGNVYRVRSVKNVLEEVAYIKKTFPGIRELFFDDDTLTEYRDRTHELAKGLKPFNLSWGCNSKANVDFETLKVMRESGCRVMVVGYESGNQKILNNIKKGIRVDQAEKFTRDAHQLGMTIHGTFIVGLPGETRQTIDETIAFASRLNIETLQVSLASPYPGTHFYEYARENGYLVDTEMVSDDGFQSVNVAYPDITAKEIFMAVPKFYREYYFRPRYVWKVLKRAMFSVTELKKTFREAREFFRFMAKRRESEKAHQTT
ncbi:MAG: hopanoid biosynthesis associated radical SAM protein HpnJ [Nitrospirota bacterium]|nr:hopanoid biosynthesis associated radical SAM protein HpnJ [Nitrospirota bacterium]